MGLKQDLLKAEKACLSVTVIMTATLQDFFLLTI